MNKHLRNNVTDASVRTKWKVNDVIRHIRTGHPFLVIHIRKYLSTTVIDLQDDRELRPSLELMPSHYDDYTADYNMIEKGTDSDTMRLEYKPCII